MVMSPEVQYLTIHGHRRAFVKMGQGPAVLLLHGLGCDHTTWLPVIRALARRYTVIAPDLLGHGLSAKPRADYSVGGYANGMRDLLTVLGIDKVTVVGHSFGGGVAMPANTRTSRPASRHAPEPRLPLDDSAGGTSLTTRRGGTAGCHRRLGRCHRSDAAVSQE